ncbi:RecT-like ssDNA binding protein [Gordonia phage Posh]|nr:RecT-like ssDNA binding protein [Gordonia phage Posh]UOW93725.1 RecT-like ssDNA binding protein [Gordonia phage Wrigley]
MTTTTDVAHTPADDSLSVLPPAQPMQSQSVAQLMEHAKAMNTAYELAEAMCGTALVPATYRGKPQDGTAAILYGAELGLTPIQSLQQIFVVHGTPAIYARTMVALLKSRGFKIWTESSSDEAVTVMGQAPDGTAEGSTWTIERAEKAGYVPTIDDATGKYKVNSKGNLIGNEKYLTDPQAMLYAKAAAEVCRRLAPDVLLGIAYTREDLESETPEDGPRRVPNEQQASAPGVDDLRKRLGIAAAPKPAPEPDAPAAEAAEAAGESTESDTAAPSKDDTRRLNQLFSRAGIGGTAATLKAKRKTVTEKLIERTIDSDTPLTADECLKVIDQLDALIAQGEADGRGDAALIETVAALIDEGATDSDGAR